MKQFLVFILLVSIFFGLTFSRVSAQQVCESCGYCEELTPPANWDKCATCLYPGVVGRTPSSILGLGVSITPALDKAYTVFGCVGTTQGGFVDFLVSFLSSLSVGIAFLGIIYGGIKVMLARGNPEELNEGRRYIYGAIVGLLVVFFAVFLVRIVGKDILKLPFLQ